MSLVKIYHGNLSEKMFKEEICDRIINYYYCYKESGNKILHVTCMNLLEELINKLP